MAACLLFIDYENVYRALKGQNIAVTHAQLVEIFRAEAAQIGELIFAAAYAPWDLFPEAMPVLDRGGIKPEYVEGGRKDNADLVMSLAVQQSLSLVGSDVDTVIIATGDGDFIHVIRLLQLAQKRTVVWGVDGSISARLTGGVAEVANLQDLFRKHGIELQPFAPAPSGPLMSVAAGLSPELKVRAIVLRAEAVMLTRGWVQLPFLTLIDEMSDNPIFGESVEERRRLLVRCLDAGVLETKKQPNPRRPGTNTTFVLMKKETPAVQQTLQLASLTVRCLRGLGQPDAGRQYVTVNDLVSPLAAEFPAAKIEPAAWIQVCLLEGMLRIDSGQHLQLNGDHPLAKQVSLGQSLEPDLRVLILTLEDYLVRSGHAWMSMGLLRRELAGRVPLEIDRIIRAACERGIIIVRQQSYRFGSRPTAGVHLVRDHELVRKTLAAAAAGLEFQSWEDH